MSGFEPLDRIITADDVKDPFCPTCGERTLFTVGKSTYAKWKKIPDIIVLWRQEEICTICGYISTYCYPTLYENDDDYEVLPDDYEPENKLKELLEALDE